MQHSGRSVAVWTILAILGSTPALVAQEPRNHIPFCGNDANSARFVDQVRYLVAGTDSASQARQAAVGLEPMAAAEVSIVVEDAVCVDASAAYAREARLVTVMPPPFPVVVVRARDRYLVQLVDTAGRDAARWEVVVFDQVFRRLGSYGSGDRQG